jgi:hypothetical protein
MKKTRLLEMIREEIRSVLRETSNIDEELLNEIPIYNVDDMEGFKSTLNKFKEEGTSKSKALNLLLTKLEDEGTVDTNQLSKDLGVDSATFNNQETRKFLNRPEDQVFTDKSGAELIDFTPYLNVSNKARGPKAGEKAAAKGETTPTAKPTTTPTKPTATPAASTEEKPTATPTKPERETPEEKANKSAQANAGLNKKADKKDELLKDKKAAEDRMREIVKLINSTGKTEALMKDLKQANADKLKVEKEIDRLF